MEKPTLREKIKQLPERAQKCHTLTIREQMAWYILQEFRGIEVHKLLKLTTGQLGNLVDMLEEVKSNA